ncbi:HK97 family phage prohead protease [uncultured Luteimonas sp.]|uniref:HK97 family phage prohead protease n=1 Tax=uncultured Luteimonas sp. TaxID=453144 RepID=UPI0026342226|nr:HK97 family phage prohead protease [uncultured Luteimonas sp.]
MDTTLEQRFARGAKVEGRELVGLAAPFGSETRIADFSEVIAAGAFAASLSSGRDVLALADHDPAKVLGRTSTGSLQLRETADGLEYRLTLPDTTTGNDLRALAARGDLGGVSFGFRAIRESWEGEVRTLHEVELHEVSIVQAWPAYAKTTVSLRSRQTTDDDRLAVLRHWLETCR